MLIGRLIKRIRRLRRPRFVPNPFLERNLHNIGCETETIEVCGCKVILITPRLTLTDVQDSGVEYRD